MSYNRHQWVDAWLRAAGNTAPTLEVVNVGIAWTQYESTGEGLPVAAFNLLNTIQDAPGTTNFNTFGDQGQYHVKNYPSFEVGVKANATALLNGHYPELAHAFVNNDLHALLNPSPNMLQEYSTWGTGHGNAIARLSTQGGLLRGSESFQGDGPAVTLPPLEIDTAVVKGIESLVQTINDDLAKAVGDIEKLSTFIEKNVESKS